jgi:monofunctional biosynthetic peptidoglycan transglycosylase
MVRQMTIALLMIPAMAAVAAFAFGHVSMQDSGVATLIDFRSGSDVRWYRVNDGVMGGRSSSSLSLTDEGTAVFDGNLSLENNGGFASVRAEVAEGSLAEFSRLVIRVRGDGKSYQMRLRMSSAFDGIAYRATFETTADEWTTVEIPFSAFEPSFRGYRPRNAEPLDPARVRQIGFMLTDKQEGRFRLEIAWIGAS